MPKTYTDDLGPPLPSLVDGPFEIRDPSDAESWIKIDPANAEISSAGNARPTRLITTGFVRASGSAYSQYIGSYMAARSVSANVSGGFHLAPICIPEDMDVSEPCYVRLLISPLTDATTNGQVIRFGLALTSVTQTGVMSNSSVTCDWNVPDDWTTSEYKVVLIDNGNGRTFDPDTFTNRDVVGFRIRRVGTAAADTFDKGVKIAEFLQIEYTASKC